MKKVSLFNMAAAPMSAGLLVAFMSTVSAQTVRIGMTAADIPRRAPVMKAAAPVAVFDWTGLYIGGYAGVGVNRSHIVDPTGAALGEINVTGSGFTGGGTLGYNLQFWGSWVAGVEGDFGALNLGHSTLDYNEALVYDSKTSSIGTLKFTIL